MSRFNRKMTLKRLCSVQLGESCSRNLGNTSKNSYLMSPVQLNSASSTCPKSVQKEKEFTITAWHSFFKVSSLYTRPISHTFKKFYRIQRGPYFFQSSTEYSETSLFTRFLKFRKNRFFCGGLLFFFHIILSHHNLHSPDGGTIWVDCLFLFVRSILFAKQLKSR